MMQNSGMEQPGWDFSGKIIGIVMKPLGVMEKVVIAGDNEVWSH